MTSHMKKALRVLHDFFSIISTTPAIDRNTSAAHRNGLAASPVTGVASTAGVGVATASRIFSGSKTSPSLKTTRITHSYSSFSISIKPASSEKSFTIKPPYSS